MSNILKGLQLNELSPATLASYKKKAGAEATAADKAGDIKKADKRFSGIVKATKKEFDNDSKDVKEAGNNYHANRTGFSRGQRDDERHDLDKPTQVWGLKINGKVWSKGGVDVTFNSKEAALNIRNSILKNRPDLEIGLVTKGGVAEGRYDSDDYYNPRMSRDYGARNLHTDSGAYEFEKNVPAGEPGGQRGAPKSLKGISKALPADAFGRTTGKIPAGKPGRIHSMMNDVDEELDENLHKWFKEKWVRFGPDGKIRGDCARGDDSEGKPKCLPQNKAHSLGKKGRASAAARKRREDPNPERSGKAINVNTKKKSNESVVQGRDEGNFVGDTPVNLGGVAVKNLSIGDIVSYLGQKAKIVAMSKTGNTSRIHIPSGMGGVTKDVLTKDLKRTSLSEEELDEACWKGYHKEGNKKMFGKTYPNCVKNTNESEEGDLYAMALQRYPQLKRVDRETVVNALNGAYEDYLMHYGYEGIGPDEESSLIDHAVKSLKKGVSEAHHSETCPHCGGEMVSEELMNEKKDACYYKVKSRYKVWPSAYASGALVKCRKKGASNWGNGGKSNESIEEDDAHDVEQRMIAKIAKYKEHLAHLKKTDPEAYKREIAKSKTSGKVPPVSTFEDQGVAEGSEKHECPECDGSGYVQWHGSDTECPKCDGTGYVEQGVAEDQLDEKWTKKYKDSINCSNPKGFSQKAHCAGKKKNESAIMSGLNQLDEGWKEKLGAAALAGSMALGAGAAHSRVTPDGQGGFTGGLKPTATVTAPSDNKPAAEAPKGFSKEYLQSVIDGKHPRPMISVEKAQELLKNMP